MATFPPRPEGRSLQVDVKGVLADENAVETFELSRKQSEERRVFNSFIEAEALSGVFAGDDEGFANDIASEVIMRLSEKENMNDFVISNNTLINIKTIQMMPKAFEEDIMKATSEDLENKNKNSIKNK